MFNFRENEVNLEAEKGVCQTTGLKFFISSLTQFVGTVRLPRIVHKLDILPLIRAKAREYLLYSA